MHFDLMELRDELIVKNFKDLLVLDGDWLVFKAMSAAEVETEWENDVWTLECDHKLAKEILDEDIKSWITRKARWKNAVVVMAFSSDTNWRKLLVDPTYKQNRKSVRKPVGYKKFLQDLMDGDQYMTVSENNLEADDVIGIIASGWNQFGAENTTIISCDKDFRTIPNCDFLWCSNGNIYRQTEETADFWHLYQTMKGDLTDGYSGIKGWGDKSEEFLKNPYYLREVDHLIASGKNKGKTEKRYVKEDKLNKTLWECILSVAHKAGMNEDDVIKQARLARILRFNDYDLENAEIKPWHPSLLSL